MKIDQELALILEFFSFWLGASIGSFLNVVVWRVPRGESIVRPPSHCPRCGAAIRWWQNIPVVSWLALRGRCASCREPISPRYILVEALCGALFLAAFAKYGAECVPNIAMLRFTAVDVVEAVYLVAAWAWIALMVAGSFIDFDHQLLPDFTTVGGMVLGVVLSLVPTGMNFAFLGGAEVDTIRKLSPLLNSVVGLAFGFGLLWLVRWLGSKAFKREAMGMGDVFLMGAVGALFGPVAVLVTLVLSSVVGSVVGVAMIMLSKAKLGRFVAIPYGPYICMGCLAWMFFGPELVDWYLRLVACR